MQKKPRANAIGASSGGASARGAAARAGAACLFLAAFAAHFAACDNLAGINEWATYTVVFHANGGEGAAPPAAHRHGTPHSLPDAEAFRRSGHGFEGWSKSPNAAAAEFAPGQTVSGLGYRCGAIVSLFAVWSAKAFAIIYDPNGGEGERAHDEREFLFGSAMYLLPNAFSRPEPYAFIGWALSPGGAVAIENQGCASAIEPEKSGAEITLYAVWRAGSFAVEFHPNGAIGEGPAQRAAEAGGSLTLPNRHGLEKEGHVFGGWSLQADGEGRVYAAGDSFAPSGNATLFAVWRPFGAILFTIAFSANGGEGSPPQDRQVPQFGTAALPGAGGLSKPGYLFTGWSASPFGGGAVAVLQEGDEIHFVSGDLTLHAIWQRFLHYFLGLWGGWGWSLPWGSWAQLWHYFDILREFEGIEGVHAGNMWEVGQWFNQIHRLPGHQGYNTAADLKALVDAALIAIIPNIHGDCCCAEDEIRNSARNGTDITFMRQGDWEWWSAVPAELLHYSMVAIIGNYYIVGVVLLPPVDTAAAIYFDGNGHWGWEWDSGAFPEPMRWYCCCELDELYWRLRSYWNWYELGLDNPYWLYFYLALPGFLPDYAHIGGYRHAMRGWSLYSNAASGHFVLTFDMWHRLQPWQSIVLYAIWERID